MKLFSRFRRSSAVKVFAGEMIYQQKIYPYQIIFSSRKTLLISVHPNQSIIVRAPLKAEIKQVQQKIEQAAAWIKSKIQHFAQRQYTDLINRYHEGESHSYLGCAYSLKLEVGEKNQVSLQDGFISITCKDKITPELVRENLTTWYHHQAKIVFEKLFIECWPRFNHPQHQRPKLRIRAMKSRWGSLSLKTLTVTLNSELIKFPQACIEYVIFHEFCHLEHAGHGRDFYNLLQRALPDWRQRKKQLAGELSVQ